MNAGDPRGEVVELRLGDVAAGDQCLGRREDGLVILVSGPCVPGDTVRARLNKIKHSHALADLIEVIDPAPERIAPPCAVFDRCGGCKWQMLPYPDELRWKERQVRAAVERIGGLEDALVEAVRPAPADYGYRNRIEMGTTAEGLGMHRTGEAEQLAVTDQCLLGTPGINRVLQELHGLIRRDGNPGIRRIVVREGNDEAIALLAVISKPSRWPEAWTEALKPHTAALMLEATRSGKLIRLHGRDELLITLGDLDFEVPIRSFFQVNTRQAEQLAAMVRDEALDCDVRQALDLYCGVGTFSLVLARAGLETTGLECDEAAILRAVANARRNRIGNATFAVSRLGSMPLPRDLRPELVLLDPPRAGAAPQLIREIAALAPQHLLYVSCDPATFARDAKRLGEAGYAVRFIRPVDLFPRTAHVELFARFERA